MASNDDFVNWSDLDLDELLGEYTDDQIVSDTENDSCVENDDPNKEDSSKAKGVRKTPKTPKTSKGKVTYNCPLCPKTYTSIQGFRGHITKKHDRPDIKGKKTI